MSSDKSLLFNRWAARWVVVWNRVPQCGNTGWRPADDAFYVFCTATLKIPYHLVMEFKEIGRGRRHKIRC
jgi:hypothetical protein